MNSFCKPPILSFPGARSPSVPEFQVQAILGVFLAVALLATGCATPQELTTQFDEAQFERFNRDGTSAIVGQAFLKTRGGQVRFAAGNNVYLIPSTPYTQEAVKLAETGKASKKDPRLQKFVKTSVADGSGNFEFKNLPDGEFYLECGIFWEIPSPYPGGILPQTTGAWVRKFVTTKPGETQKVILTAQ